MVDVLMRKRRDRLPRPVRIAVDWAVTIVVAVLAVIVLKSYIVTPYRIPSGSMEPTLSCARPGTDCDGRFSDRVLACRICLDLSGPSRGDIVVFDAPAGAARDCGEGGTFVKRLIGLPGDTVSERNGAVFVNGRRLDDSYVEFRDGQTATWHVSKGEYFFMGDNRRNSCDSRQWGSVPRSSLIGTVIFRYWPPTRIGVP